ncbi:hypothetical protein ENLAB_33070 (plasmid) [Enterococcus innesii]|uniref:Mga helix-turn-helix domain-containing protein n=2 Tax=Enterococcus innesii TaxID=2839759 RepID=A0ABM7XX33_9ENTE|nr:hypothetical protein ENLAB_33070 [Enterococcus innesii]
MSEFLINKTTKELNLDFYELGLNEEFEIMTDGITIYLNESGSVTSDMLLTYYLEKSIKISMLKECFFEQLSSLYDFAVDHFYSRNPTYKEFKQFKKILERYGIEVTKKFQLLGDERKLREFFFIFFMKYSPRKDRLFPEEIKERISSFSRFHNHYWFNPNQAKNMEIRKSHYLGIVITRLLNGHSIKNAKGKHVASSKHNTIIKEIESWLHTLTRKIPADSIENEAKEILHFLIVEGWLVDNEKYMDQDQPYIKKLNDKLYQAIQTEFNISNEVKKILYEETTSIHYQLLSFSFSSKYEYYNIDVSFFLEAYPEFTKFCREFLEENRYCPILWDNKEFLFFRYLFLMIAKVPLKEILSPIYICIDFSFGNFYNRMVRKNINKLIDLNICFQEYPDENTQLILTNMSFYDSTKIDYILWLTPPRPSDWVNFTNKVNSIRLKKFVEENNN